MCGGSFSTAHQRIPCALAWTGVHRHSEEFEAEEPSAGEEATRRCRVTLCGVRDSGLPDMPRCTVPELLREFLNKN
jgi:hypothetical protein